MFAYDLKNVRELRLKLGLTQRQLAKLAGVSQSMIAKIEANRVSPSFDVAVKIFRALESVRAEKEAKVKAAEIATKELIFVNKGDYVSKAIDLMIKHNVSQLPVFDGEVPIGSISEATIVRNMDRIGADRTRVEEIMDECFPIVPEDMSISTLKEILIEYQAVLVQRNGKIVGIVTKADLLKAIK